MDVLLGLGALLSYFPACIFVLKYMQDVHLSGDYSLKRRLIGYGYLVATSQIPIALLASIWLPAMGLVAAVGMVALTIGIFHYQLDSWWGHGCLISLLTLVCSVLAIGISMAALRL